MRFIREIDRILGKIEVALLIFLLAVMVMLSFGQVLLRNFLNEGIIWADIFLRQLVLWVGFLGASLAVRARKHLAIDFLSHFLPPEWNPLLKAGINFTAGVISILLGLAAWSFVQFEMEGGSNLFNDIPVWVFQTILPYSFGAISFRFFLNSLEDWKTFREPAS